MPTNVHSLRKWRIAILALMGTAFALELTARYLRGAQIIGALTSKSISMAALALLCASALWLMLKLRQKNFLKGAVLIATAVLLLAQLVSIAREFHFFPESGGGAEALLLLAGVVLLLTTYYFALLEMIWMENVLRQKHDELYAEIGERSRAEAKLHESRDDLRRLSMHMEDLREAERKRVARELHDQLGQDLTCLKIDLANLSRRMKHADADEECKSILVSMSGQTDSLMQATRRIISELHPVVLDDLGLPDAIKWLASDFENRTQISCMLRLNADASAPNSETSAALFRVTQECLTNVARHAGATEVQISLTISPEKTVLDVKDNGRGMNGAATNGKKNSFGILGMRERVALLGGDFQIETENGKGTRILIAIP